MTTFYIFLGGMFTGVFIMSLMDRWTIRTYRRWYLMVRTELERIDPTNRALGKIGARTSKRESWED